MDLPSWTTNNMDFLERLATLVWIHQGDPGMMDKITTARVGYELYQRLSGERDVEALRNQTILNIVKYIKDHPKARKEDVQQELAKQIYQFAQQVDKL